ncbi:unnamed protein product, partial [Coregonus sp. 'balchen']
METSTTRTKRKEIEKSSDGQLTAKYGMVLGTPLQNVTVGGNTAVGDETFVCMDNNADNLRLPKLRLLPYDPGTPVKPQGSELCGQSDTGETVTDGGCSSKGREICQCKCDHQWERNPNQNFWTEL